MEMKSTKGYKVLAFTLTVSFIIMYLVMFLNVDELEHVYLSTTRAYMSLLMIAPMALLMIIMMPGMYNNRRLNSLVILLSVAVFVLALLFLRNQTLVSEAAYMKAMIPHHSSAIMVSEKADIKDPQLKDLAEKIIKSQKKEIQEMKDILKRMEKD